MIPLTAIPCAIGIVGGNILALVSHVKDINQGIRGEKKIGELIESIGKAQLKRLILTFGACAPIILQGIPEEWLTKLGISKNEFNKAKNGEQPDKKDTTTDDSTKASQSNPKLILLVLALLNL